jgi:hypothetical protein
MFCLVRLFVESFARLTYSRRDLLLENLALRQQQAVLKSKNRRPRLAISDKFFWVLPRRLWAGWIAAWVEETGTQLTATVYQ